MRKVSQEGWEKHNVVSCSTKEKGLSCKVTAGVLLGCVCVCVEFLHGVCS